MSSGASSTIAAHSIIKIVRVPRDRNRDLTSTTCQIGCLLASRSEYQRPAAITQPLGGTALGRDEGYLLAEKFDPHRWPRRNRSHDSNGWWRPKGPRSSRRRRLKRPTRTPHLLQRRRTALPRTQTLPRRRRPAVITTPVRAALARAATRAADTRRSGVACGRIRCRLARRARGIRCTATLLAPAHSRNAP
jgi:hypothetical protein